MLLGDFSKVTTEALELQIPGSSPYYAVAKRGVSYSGTTSTAKPNYMERPLMAQGSEGAKGKSCSTEPCDYNNYNDDTQREQGRQEDKETTRQET